MGEVWPKIRVAAKPKHTYGQRVWYRPNVISIAYRRKETHKNWNIGQSISPKMVEGKYNKDIPLRSDQVSDSTRNEQGHETLKRNSLTLFTHWGVPSLIAWALRLVERPDRHPTNFDLAQGYVTN